MFSTGIKGPIYPNYPQFSTQSTEFSTAVDNFSTGYIFLSKIYFLKVIFAFIIIFTKVFHSCGKLFPQCYFYSLKTNLIDYLFVFIIFYNFKSFSLDTFFELYLMAKNLIFLFSTKFSTGCLKLKNIQSNFQKWKFSDLKKF